MLVGSRSRTFKVISTAKRPSYFTLQKDLPPGELVKKKVFLLAASIENTGNGIYCYREVVNTTYTAVHIEHD